MTWLEHLSCIGKAVRLCAVYEEYEEPTLEANTLNDRQYKSRNPPTELICKIKFDKDFLERICREKIRT
jgi:hypothetical protein